MSNIGGETAVTTSFASTESALGGTDALIYEDRNQGQSFDGLPGLDSAHFFNENEAHTSPVTSSSEGDFITGAFNPAGPSFDLGDFLNLEANPFSMDPVSESDDAAADYRFAPLDHDSENHLSSENLFSQPPSGASTLGCDVGSIAVGF